MSSGGDGILTVTGFGRFEKLHAEYNKLLQANQKLVDQLKRVETQSKKTDERQEEAADRVVQKGIKMAAVWQAASSALGIFNDALQKNIELSSRAAASSTSLADAQTSFFAALGPNASSDFRKRAAKEIQSFGVSQGMTETNALLAFEKIMNSVTDANPEVRLAKGKELMNYALKFFPNPNDAVQLGSFGAAGGDLLKGLAGATPKDVMKIEAGLLGASRLEGADKLVNVNQAIVAAQITSPHVKDQMENSLQAAAITAALGIRMGDADGEITRTAAAGLFGVFRGLAGTKYADLPIGEAIKRASAEDPGLMKKVNEQLIGRTFTKDPQRELLQGGITGVMADIARNELNVTDVNFDAFIQDLQAATPEQQRVKSSRRVAAISDRANRAKATAGSIRGMLFGEEMGDEWSPGYFESTQNSIAGAIDVRLKRLMFDIALARGGDPTGEGFALIQAEVDRWAGSVRNFRAAKASRKRGFGALTDAELEGREEEAMRRMREAEAVRDAIIQLPSVIQDNTNTVSNGMNAQAATAQRHAHVE